MPLIMHVDFVYSVRLRLQNEESAWGQVLDSPEIPCAVMASSQVSEQIALHELHDHPDVIALECHPKELHDILVPAAPQNGDFLQQQLPLSLAHIPFKNLHCHFMNVCQHALVDLQVHRVYG